MPGTAAAVTAAAVIKALIAYGWPAIAAYAVGAAVSYGVAYGISAAIGGDKMPDFGGSSALQRNANRTISVRQSVAAHRVIYGETRVGGIITFIHTTDDTKINNKLHQLVTMAGHEVNQIGKVWLDDVEAEFTASAYPNAVTGPDPYGGGEGVGEWVIRIYKGTGTTAGDADLNTALQANTSQLWTSDHRQSGRAKMYVEFTHDSVFESDAFVNGMPNITALVQGRLVFDPRDSTTAYSNNAALCIRDYLTNTEFGLGEPVARINEIAFQTAANLCDEDVSLTAGGTEKRYTCNGIFHTDQTPKQILGQLLTSCAGRLTYQGGQWSLYAGAYIAPTITLDESDLDGGLSITTQIGRRNLLNTARGVYVEPSNLYQPTDFPVIKNSVYLAQDQGETIAKDFDWAFTASSATAQRLAKIELEKVRQQITVQMPVSLKNGLRVQSGDCVAVTNSRMGWTAKPFLIEEWGFAQRGTPDEPTLGVDLVLRETASSVYSWTSGEETQVDPAPNTTLPLPSYVTQPSDLQVVEELYYTSTSSGVKSRATLSWTNLDSFEREYEIEYKLSSASTYIFVTSVTTTTFQVDDLAPEIYDVRVRTVNLHGAKSAWTYETFTIFGLTAKPADITGFSIRAMDGSVYLTWNPITDLDVIHGGYIRVRHTALVSGATWDSGIDIGRQLPGTATDVVLTLVAGTYMCKAVDSGGNFSNGYASSITTVKNIHTFNVAESLTDSPGFSGTKTNMVVSGSVLRLASLSADNTGYYDFASNIDLGSVFTSRVNTEFESSSYTSADTVDQRTTLVDTWRNFDGEQSDLIDATVQVRTTDDDPAASPTWSEWRNLTSADFRARGFDFRVFVESSTADYNIDITKLKVIVDMPDRFERASNLSSGTSAYSVTYGAAFYVTPTVVISADAHAGNFVVTNSSTTGFDVNFYDGSGTGTPADVTFNYQAVGY